MPDSDQSKKTLMANITGRAPAHLWLTPRSNANSIQHQKPKRQCAANIASLSHEFNCTSASCVGSPQISNSAITLLRTTTHMPWLPSPTCTICKVQTICIICQSRQSIFCSTKRDAQELICPQGVRLGLEQALALSGRTCWQAQNSPEK